MFSFLFICQSSIPPSLIIYILAPVYFHSPRGGWCSVYPFTCTFSVAFESVQVCTCLRYVPVSLSSLSVAGFPIGENDKGLQICLLACSWRRLHVRSALEWQEATRRFGVTKKKFQKGHTQAPRIVVCGKKENCCTSSKTTESKGSTDAASPPSRRIASKNPQATAEPSALTHALSPLPDRPQGED